MNNQRIIPIPFDLAKYSVSQRSLVRKYETNAIIKALDTWLVLKSETRSGMIQNWNLQKNYLFTICKITESVFRARIRLLKEMRLLQYDRKKICLCSWDDLGRLLDIDISNRFNIVYDISNCQRLQEWFIATEIKGNQLSQSYSILKKVNENPAKKQRIVNALFKAGADMNRLKDGQYLITWLMIMYRQDFVQASEIHDLLIEIRPDTNRGVRRMAEHWKCKSTLTVSYWKAVLKKAGIVDISSLQIESNDRVRNNQCKVIWLKKSQQTMLCLCDSIEILEPWRIKDYASNKYFFE